MGCLSRCKIDGKYIGDCVVMMKCLYKQVSLKWVTNYIPRHSVRFNHPSLPQIPACWMQVLQYRGRISGIYSLWPIAMPEYHLLFECQQWANGALVCSAHQHLSRYHLQLSAWYFYTIRLCELFTKQLTWGISFRIIGIRSAIYFRLEDHGFILSIFGMSFSRISPSVD